MRFFAVLFSFLFSLSSLSAQPVDKIDRVMTDTLRAWKIPGASIAVVQDDRVIFLKGYGTKELGGAEAVTPDTLFQIA
jgi:CubicO group peptidase (beta-lactamase class C family)